MPECPKCDYDQVATDYHRRYQRTDYAPIAELLLAKLSAYESPRVLEVGCGTGHWLELLASRGFDVTGLDASPDMLEVARQRVPANVLNEGAAESLPFDDASFDFVFCVNAFHHFSGKQEAISEARRVLRSGGRFVTIGCDPHTGDDRWFLWDYFDGALARDHVRYRPTGEIRQWMEDAGFTECRTEVAIHFCASQSADAVFEAGRLERAAASQLALASEAEYGRGIERIREDMHAAERRGEELQLAIDLKLHATSGVVSGG